MSSKGPLEDLLADLETRADYPEAGESPEDGESWAPSDLGEIIATAQQQQASDRGETDIYEIEGFDFEAGCAKPCSLDSDNPTPARRKENWNEFAAETRGLAEELENSGRDRLSKIISGQLDTLDELVKDPSSDPAKIMAARDELNQSLRLADSGLTRHYTNEYTMNKGWAANSYSIVVPAGGEHPTFTGPDGKKLTFNTPPRYEDNITRKALPGGGYEYRIFQKPGTGDITMNIAGEAPQSVVIHDNGKLGPVSGARQVPLSALPIEGVEASPKLDAFKAKVEALQERLEKAGHKDLSKKIGAQLEKFSQRLEDPDSTVHDINAARDELARSLNAASKALSNPLNIVKTASSMSMSNSIAAYTFQVPANETQPDFSYKGPYESGRIRIPQTGNINGPYPNPPVGHSPELWIKRTGPDSNGMYNYRIETCTAFRRDDTVTIYRPGQPRIDISWGRDPSPVKETPLKVPEAPELQRITRTPEPPPEAPRITREKELPKDMPPVTRVPDKPEMPPIIRVPEKPEPMLGITRVPEKPEPRLGIIRVPEKPEQPKLENPVMRVPDKKPDTQPGLEHPVTRAPEKKADPLPRLEGFITLAEEPRALTPGKLLAAGSDTSPKVEAKKEAGDVLDDPEQLEDEDICGGGWDPGNPESANSAANAKGLEKQEEDPDICGGNEEDGERSREKGSAEAEKGSVEDADLIVLDGTEAGSPMTERKAEPPRVKIPDEPLPEDLEPAPHSKKAEQRRIPDEPLPEDLEPLPPAKPEKYELSDQWREFRKRVGELEEKLQQPGVAAGRYAARTIENRAKELEKLMQDPSASPEALQEARKKLDIALRTGQDLLKNPMGIEEKRCRYENYNRACYTMEVSASGPQPAFGYNGKVSEKHGPSYQASSIPGYETTLRGNQGSTHDTASYDGRTFYVERKFNAEKNTWQYSLYTYSSFDGDITVKMGDKSISLSSRGGSVAPQQAALALPSLEDSRRVPEAKQTTLQKDITAALESLAPGKDAIIGEVDGRMCRIGREKNGSLTLKHYQEDGSIRHLTVRPDGGIRSQRGNPPETPLEDFEPEGGAEAYWGAVAKRIKERDL